MLKRLPLPWVIGSACALLLGLLVGPVVVYWVGGKVVGDYADAGGLLALWGSIYGDAARLGGGGLILLLGPLIMFQIGWLVFRARKRFSNQSGQNEPSQN